jgi:hypothetical protein
MKNLLLHPRDFPSSLLFHPYAFAAVDIESGYLQKANSNVLVAQQLDSSRRIYAEI